MNTELPIIHVLPQLKHALAAHPIVLLSAEPGAGKTTQVPLALLHEPWLGQQKILLLEPRRLAARNAASFMARNLHQALGQSVGYRLRLEQKVSANTRIEVITEGILTRMLQADPALTGVGLIIFDEFHERNLHSDLALALTHHCQQLLRDDLKILIMSATLDQDTLAETLQAPIIRCAGRSFPVAIHYRPATSPHQRLAEHVKTVVLEALQEQGDILVFLPGVKAINQCQQALASLNEQALVLPLHGQLNDQQQQQVFAPAPLLACGQRQRKIILATNIAESSLTLDGVSVVIDSGLERRSEFQLNSGLTRLTSKMISQASSLQRAGRAGRQSAGVCFRLWPESQQARLAAHIRAEILDADLTSLLAELYQWGASVEELFWLTPPPASALQYARQQLIQLNMLSADRCALSKRGQQIAALPLPPAWGHALLVFHQLGRAKQAGEWLALLQEWPHSLRQSDDFMRVYQAAQRHPLWAQRIKPLAASLLQRVTVLDISPQPIALSEAQAAALFLALAFPQHLACQRAHSEVFLLASGQGAHLSMKSDLIHATWLACADLSSSDQASKSSTIRLAAPFDPSLLALVQTFAPAWFSTHTKVEWQANGQLLAAKIDYLGKIELKRRSLPQLNDAEWHQAWKHYLEQHGLDCLPWDTPSKQLRHRLALVHEHQPEHWPDVSTAALLQQLEQWLLPFLTSARHLRDLEKLDLMACLTSLLDYPQQQQLQQLLPTHLQVPSGSFIALDYSVNPPVLAVKLQEMFGYQGQPSVMAGQLPISLHLLSPARRPLQITRDLAYFWQHSYAEVRKEMRGRYPKHPWPEDPLNTAATRFTKARAKLEQQG